MGATEQQLLDRAKELIPVLKERWKKSDELRRVPDETIADFHEAGFFKMLQPKRWGGLECDPNAFFDVQTTIASACPSSAWVFGVVAVHSWQLALFDEQAQKDVWGDDPSTLISSSYAPTGKVEAVEGGYKATRFRGAGRSPAAATTASGCFSADSLPRKRARPRTCARSSCRAPTTSSTITGTPWV